MCMWIAFWHTSSAQLPRIEIKGKDTCAVIPIADLRIANIKFIELDGCREENDSLFSKIRIYTGLTNNLKASITELKEVNKLNQSLLADSKKIIDLNAQELKKQARKGRLLRTERNGLVAVVVVLIAKMAFF